MHTKKVGSAGRFGNKYGSKIRVAVAKAEKDSRSAHICPKCLSRKLIRKAAGIWTCRKCETTFAGGAYSPTTAATKIMSGEVAAFVEEAPAETPKEAAAEKKVMIHAAPKEEKSETEDIKEEKTRRNRDKTPEPADSTQEKKRAAAKKKSAKKEKAEKGE